MDNKVPEEYLLPGIMIDSDHPVVIEFTKRAIGDTADKVEQAVKLYYAIRDGFMYDPFHVDLTEDALKASTLIKKGSGFCVEKAGLLAACARVVGIPSRIGLADVKNHIGTEKLVELLRSDIFACHGFTELFLNGKWVKATPAFNLALCQKLGVHPLDFDGLEDSIFQEYDGAGERKFMEYLKDYGTFTDIPRELMIEVLQNYYPHLFNGTVLNDNDVQGSIFKI